jgi:uncharacterized protein (UPF0335 family)
MSECIDGIAAEAIYNAVNRVERIEEEVAERNADKSEVFKDLKAKGLDPKIVKALVGERRKKRKDPAGAQEQEALLDLYRDAFEMVDERKKTGHARVQVREAAE